MKWQWQRKGHEQLKATQLSHANSRLFSKVTRAGRDKVSLNSLLKKKKSGGGREKQNCLQQIGQCSDFCIFEQTNP